MSCVGTSSLRQKRRVGVSIRPLRFYKSDTSVRAQSGNATLCHSHRPLTFRQSSLSSSGLAKHLCARRANNDSLGVREHRSDGKAPGTLDVHEERVGVLDQPLELVGALLLLSARVEEIDSESLFREAASRVCVSNSSLRNSQRRFDPASLQSHPPSALLPSAFCATTFAQ